MSDNEFKASDFAILIVDDLPKNLQVLGSILKTQNYHVEFATSGKSALSWLEKKSFDVALLDLMMPEMDGFEVCSNIRKNKSLDSMPVIFLTAKIDKESIVKGFELGGQDYITKPFDSSELLARVKTHLELRKSKQRLMDINKWLEQKVEERTDELKIANQKLTEANTNLEALSKQLISLDAEKTNFLQIISHEIRTPLNAIKGFLGLAKNRVKEEKILSYFNYIDEASYRLEKFAIQAILITELKIDKYPLKKESIRLKENLEQLISSKFLRLLEEKDLKVDFELSSPDIEVIADKKLFTVCISNIMDNAVNFSHPDEKIIIRAYNNDEGIIIEIRDKGPGFSEKALAHLPKLFSLGTDGFNQATGLDLAVVDLIMKTHNGRFEVVNNPNGGAIVKLFFQKSNSYEE